MPKSTDIRLVDVSFNTEEYTYRTPIKFGYNGQGESGPKSTSVTLANVKFGRRRDVETRDGRRGTGFGSMPVGNIWGWPSSELAPADTEKAMARLSEKLAEQANDYSDTGHPLEITHALSETYEPTAEAVIGELGLSEKMPKLARLVAASPLEAAIHDAYGKALGENSYNVLGAEYANRDLAAYLTDEFAGEYLDQVHVA